MTRRFAALVLAVASLLVVGCARIPTSGPVLVEPQRTHAGDQPIDIIPHAPGPRDTPRQIVQGFLHAMAEGSGNYDTARAYLTNEARTRWHPDEQALIYAAASEHWTVTDSSAVLEADVVGRLDRRGAFTRVDDAYRLDFGLVQVDGQWRIDNPPVGLLLLQDLYDHAFVTSTTYFFDPNYRVLVPDVVHQPKLRQTATSLVAGLLAGPSETLRPAVRTAFPSRAALAGEATVTSDGTATIPLSGDLGSLDETARSLLAAQIAVTLGTAPGLNVSALRITWNQNPYNLPQQEASGTVPVAQYLRYLAGNLQSGGQVFGIAQDRVVLIKDTAAGGATEPVPGPLGESGRQLDRLAVSLDSASVALVSENSSVLSAGRLVGAEPSRLLLKAPGLLTPQYTRYDELWAVAVTSAGSRVFRVVNGVAEQVEAPDLADVQVKSFRLSPDGVRMAVVTQAGTTSTLSLLQIERGDTVRVAGLRSFQLSGLAAGPARIEAVGWRSDRMMTLLATEPGRSEVNPYDVDLDAGIVRRTGTMTWDASRLQTSPYNGRFVALALGTSGQVWRRGEDAVWRKWVSGLTAVAMPG